MFDDFWNFNVYFIFVKLQNELLMNEPRRRTQIRRYGHDEGVMVDSELDSSSDSGDEEGNVGDRTRSGKGNFLVNIILLLCFY